jgi:hypothetical protein
MKKIWNLLLLLFLLGCSNSKEKNAEQGINKEDVNELKVQPYEVVDNLKDELAFEFMDEQEEPLGLYENDSKGKATTSLTQVYAFDSAEMLHVQIKNRCRAWIMDDTLHISLSSPYAGVGVKLQAINGNYMVQPYTNFAPDVVIYDENGHLPPPPQIDIQRVKLVLDKNSYVVGDSVLGYLYLRALIGENSKHYVQGYFRAKIENE